MEELEYLEAKLIDRCNFNCRACIPFSNIAGDGIYEIDEFKKDIGRLAKLYQNIKLFRLLGGEPLLLKNLNEYIQAVRKHFLQSELIIVTNGILLDGLDDEHIEYFRDNQVEIYVSVYPNISTEERVLENIAQLKEKQVKINYYKANYFCVNQCYSMRQLSEEKIQRIYERCRKVVDCTNIYKGRIYACPKPFSYVHLNRKYGTDFNFDQDGIDIHSPAINAEHIKEYLNHHMESCRLCTDDRGFIKWSGNTPGCISDWENTERNQLIINWKSGEEEIDDIFKISTMCVQKQGGQYVTYKMDLSVGVLKEIHHAVLIVLNYSVSEFELFQIACKKAGFIVDALYYDDEVYESIINKKGKRYDKSFFDEKYEDAKYLILNKSLFKSCKNANQIMNYLNQKL